MHDEMYTYAICGQAWSRVDNIICIKTPQGPHMWVQGCIEIINPCPCIPCFWYPGIPWYPGIRYPGIPVSRIGILPVAYPGIKVSRYPGIPVSLVSRPDGPW